MSEPRIKTLLTVLPVLSAGLYLVGATYLQGYLGAFGIDDSMFPAPVDRLLFSGFVALVTLGLIPMVYTLAALIVLFLAVLITAILSSVPRVQRWQSAMALRASKLRSKQPPSPKLLELVDKSGTIYMYATGAFVVCMLLLLVAVLSSRTGKEQGEREIENFLAGKGSYVTLTIDQSAPAIRAKQIICGSTYCAFWLGREAAIVRHEQIARITTHNPLLKGTAAANPASAP